MWFENESPHIVHPLEHLKEYRTTSSPLLPFIAWVLNLWLLLLTVGYKIIKMLLHNLGRRWQHSEKIRTGQNSLVAPPVSSGLLLSEPQNEGENCEWDWGDSSHNTVDLHCGPAAKLWVGGQIGRGACGWGESLVRWVHWCLFYQW